jgi:transposase
MIQDILPLIPNNTTQITALLSVWRGEDKWVYFHGTHPIYSHEPNDKAMFRFIIAHLIDTGACRQVDILNTFAVSKSFVDRATRQFREKGPESFFQTPRRRKTGTILTKEVLGKAQSLLDLGYSKRDAADELGVKYDTLRKAINDGRLKAPKRHDTAVTKSKRSETDAAAAQGMGTACTRVEERTLASFGKCMGAASEFETCMDVPNGGVLCALPALLANGLLHGAEKILGKIKGYYTAVQVLLILAFMALCRVKTTEKFRGRTPGEFGKLIGLDRAPEVRCLRNKMDALAGEDAAQHWAAHLCRFWMDADPDAAGTLYVDGHVSVYHGKKTNLPRRYVSRQRLCLRGVTDYWINDAVGRPFFVVEKAVDPGLLQTLRQDIVPRLLQDVPNQPTARQLEENPFLCRFVLVFDREGYSPAFFAEMWENHRVACITYHKFPDDPWPESWFTQHEVTSPNGEKSTMKLCEMGSLVGSGDQKMWMRQVRKLTDSGHQTSIISTAFDMPLMLVAARMFTRWCQENFFRYMIQHFEIDRIIEYGDIDFPDTEKVVNPAWRQLSKQRNRLEGKLKNRRARFGQMSMHPESENNTKKYAKWLEKKSRLLEEIEHFERELADLKTKLKETEKHICWEQLEKQDKFTRLLPNRKRLMDTVRMIAYRAETAMVSLLTGPTVDSSAARGILQDLFITEADILPDPTVKRLRIRIHSASRPATNRALLKLFQNLNEAEVEYPGTDMKMFYELSGFTAPDSGEGVFLSSQR